MSADATIEPDTKDWTWVLTGRCPDCGLDSGAVPTAELASRLRANASEWQAILTRPLGPRPSPQVWSTLEYACHVRDVLRLGDVRLRLMLTEHDPLFANWDQDATAAESDYPSEPADRVSLELGDAADAAAGHFADAAESDWARTGRRSDGASFTLGSFGQYLLHDVVHHLSDVRR